MNNFNINFKPFYSDENKTSLRGFVFTNNYNNKNLYYSINPVKELNFCENNEIDEKGYFFFNDKLKPIKNIDFFFNKRNYNKIEDNFYILEKLIEENFDNKENQNLRSFYYILKSIDEKSTCNNFSSLLEKMIKNYNYKDLNFILNDFNYQIEKISYCFYNGFYNRYFSYSYFLEKFLETKNSNNYKNVVNFILYIFNNYNYEKLKIDLRNIVMYFIPNIIKYINIIIKSKDPIFNKFSLNYLNIIKDFKISNFENSKFDIYEDFYYFKDFIIKNKNDILFEKMDIIIEFFIKSKLINELESYYNKEDYFNYIIKKLDLNVDEIIKNFNIEFSNIFKNYEIGQQFFDINRTIQISINQQLIDNYLKFSHNNIDWKDQKFLYPKNLYYKSIYNPEIKTDYILNILNKGKGNDLITNIIKENFNCKIEFDSKNLFYGKRDNILKYRNSKLESLNILYLIQMMIYSYDNPEEKYIVEIDLSKLSKKKIEDEILDLDKVFNENFHYDYNFNFNYPTIKIYKYDSKLNYSEKIFDINYTDLIYYKDTIRVNRKFVISKNIFKSIFVFLSYYNVIKSTNINKKIIDNLLKK